MTRANIERLESMIGCTVAGPGVGPLAVGEGEGPGRMLEPEELSWEVGRLLGRDPVWEGRRVLVTAGPTREALDPVRYLGNRSSGRMGWALAREAWLRGAEVRLVSGPVALPDPRGVEVTRVESAREMLAAARDRLDGVDLVIYAAAVADFRPETPLDRKLSRREGDGSAPVALAENPDVARELRPELPPGAATLGFALETAELRERAAAKLREKGFTFIAANPAGEPGVGFEAETNRILLLGPGGFSEELSLAPKPEIARLLLDRVAPHLPPTAGGGSPGPSGYDAG